MQSKQAADADFDLPATRARIQAMLDETGLMQHLGARLGEVGPGLVQVVLPYERNLTQHLGMFHAGSSAAIADAAGGWAALSLLPTDYTVLAVEFKINYLAPAVGEYLLAEGKVVRKGRNLTITQVEIYAVDGAQKTLTGLMQQTVSNVPKSRLKS